MGHVLIIEDEALIAMMIEDSLFDEGVTSVEVAASEADAIEAAKQHRPDFITSDVRLLEGTGPRAVAELCAFTATSRCCSSPPAPASAWNVLQTRSCGSLRTPARSGAGSELSSNEITELLPVPWTPR